MDINAMISDVIAKLKSDKSLLEAFNGDAVKTVEKLIGVDLPDEQINAIVEAVKAKFQIEKVSDVASGLSSLFGKGK